MRDKLVKQITDKWNKEFDEAKKECFENLRDYHFYKLSIMYEILCWFTEYGAFNLEIEVLDWLETYISLDQVREWYSERDDGIWDRLNDVVADNYQWDKDYSEREM